jgi:hypothetical protein
MTAAAAFLALALAAEPCPPPSPAPGPLPFTTGEVASYELSLFGLLRAGSLQLSVDPPMPGGRVVPLHARARTDPTLALVFRLTAVALSWVDARTLLPERYREEADEGGVHKIDDTRLGPSDPTIVIRYQIAGVESASVTPRQGAVLDAVSAVYALRAARLAPGDRFCFDLLGRGRVWRVEGVVAERRETLDTALGRLETVRLDARASLADRPGERPREMHAWFSTDARRLLVAARGEVDLGAMRLTLTAGRGGGG